jgi:general L-amino acid transport system substrate-binding protein
VIRAAFRVVLAACLFSNLLLVCLGTVPSHAAAIRVVDELHARGALPCGVVVEQEDFTKSDSHGDLSAFSAAICRAVAAAVLGDPGKLRLQGFPDDAHGITALRDNKVALLVGITPDATRGLVNHLRFSPTLFVDGQGFLVSRRLHARAPADLRGRLICYLSETPAEPGLVEWSARTHVAVRPHPFEEAGEMEAALTTGNCDAITANISALAGMRAGFDGRKADFDILPHMITVDPFAAAMRDDDPGWAAAVSDVVTALIEAEQDGITKTILAAMEAGSDPAAHRLLGPTPGLASLLGLRDGWAARAIAVSGNYGEILSGTTGPATPLNLPRGANVLWNAGGLIYAPSIP